MLVGIGSYNSITMPCEATAISKNNTTTLLMRYYNMDPVSQATKLISRGLIVKIELTLI